MQLTFIVIKGATHRLEHNVAKLKTLHDDAPTLATIDDDEPTTASYRSAGADIIFTQLLFGFSIALPTVCYTQLISAFGH